MFIIVTRWPKRVPAPGKLRDPASQYWSVQHSGHSGEWPWPGEDMIKEINKELSTAFTI